MADRYKTIIVKDFGDPLRTLPRFMANDCCVGVLVNAEDKERGLELLRSWGLKYTTTIYWSDFMKNPHWKRGVRELLLGLRGDARLRRYLGRPVVWTPFDRSREEIPPSELWEILEHVSKGPYLRVGPWRRGSFGRAGWLDAGTLDEVEQLRKEMLKSA